jgi:hypothetical protein
MAPAQPFPAGRGKLSTRRELHQLDGVEVLHAAADMALFYAETGADVVPAS